MLSVIVSVDANSLTPPLRQGYRPQGRITGAFRLQFLHSSHPEEPNPVLRPDDHDGAKRLIRCSETSDHDGPKSALKVRGRPIWTQLIDASGFWGLFVQDDVQEGSVNTQPPIVHTKSQRECTCS